MATKLTDRERKYRAEAEKAKAELKAMKARASEMSELREMFLNIGRELHRIGHEQREQYETLKRYDDRLDRIAGHASNDRELMREVNAHMWRTQNRLNAVRDILIERKASWWERLLNRLNKLIR